jgi:hypothetical protein
MDTYTNAQFGISGHPLNHGASWHNSNKRSLNDGTSYMQTKPSESPVLTRFTSSPW